jgi:hypothetical protein
LDFLGSAEKITQFQRWSQHTPERIACFNEEPPSAAFLVQDIPRGKNTWLQ